LIVNPSLVITAFVHANASARADRRLRITKVVSIGDDVSMETCRRI